MTPANIRSTSISYTGFIGSSLKFQNPENGSYVTVRSQFVYQMLVRVHAFRYVEASLIRYGLDKNKPRCTVFAFNCHETDFQNYTLKTAGKN